MPVSPLLVSPALRKFSSLLGAAWVLLVTGVAYHNSLSGPFVLDDSSSITNNLSLRSLSPLQGVFFPSAECTVAGRPFANLTFALNYAFGGTDVRGYHGVNLLIHACSALLLFGLLRRLLLKLAAQPGSRLGARFAWDAETVVVPALCAGLWSVHPLLTSSVTYISQRTELLLGCFALLTLYGLVRAADSGAKRWLLVSIVACWLGMASKEGMVVVPALALLVDATFLAGSFVAALRRRAAYYAGLVASWLLLAFLMADLKHRSVGFGLGVAWWRYALTECEAIIRYFGLVFWPHPLIFDYGAVFPANPVRIALFGAALVLLVVAALVAFRRRPMVGFCLVAFLLILSPTSSVVPISAQPMAENRVYLASAPLVLAAAFGLLTWLGRTGVTAVLLLSGVSVWCTVGRNQVLSSPKELWQDTVAKRPENPRAFENLGEVLFAEGNARAAREQFEHTLRLKPDYPEAHNNLGTCLQLLGEPALSLAHFETAVRLKPDFAAAYTNLGNALISANRPAEARVALEKAMVLLSAPSSLKVGLPETHNSLGNVLMAEGRFAEALPHFESALRLNPGFAQAQVNIGAVMSRLGRNPEAIACFEAALRLDPNQPEAHANLGFLVAATGQLDRSVEHFRAAIKAQPSLFPAQQGLADVLFHQGKRSEALVQYQQSLLLRPADPYVLRRIQECRDAGSPR